jgi:molybdopterin synthase sulfur carrier subunit
VKQKECGEMITVKFFTTLRIHLGIGEMQCGRPADNGLLRIRDLLESCEHRSPRPFLFKLIDTNGEIVPGAIIMVNGHNIHHLQGLETKVSEGDQIALFPPGGGG